MTLQQIREAKNLEELKPAIYNLCDIMQKISYGEFIAYKNTVESQAKKLNIDLKTINKLAEDYQIFGYEKA